MPDYALMRYTVPMPNNSPILGRNAEEMALNGSVLSTVKNGGPKGDCTTNFSMGSVIVKHGSPDLPTTLAEGSLAIPSRRER